MSVKELEARIADTSLYVESRILDFTGRNPAGRALRPSQRLLPALLLLGGVILLCVSPRARSILALVLPTGALPGGVDDVGV